MRRLIRPRITASRAALTLALFLAIGGVAYGASGNSLIGPHGNLNSCVPRNGGEVNLWKPGHHCSGGRVSLSWPARARNGAPGAPGAPGATGTTGATGATGPSNPAATTVDGETVSKLALRETTPGSGTTSQTLYSADGLTILALCDSTGAASLAANGPASADSALTVSGFHGTGSGAYGSQTSTLGPTSQAPLGPSGAGEATFSYANAAGQVISGQIGYESAPTYGNFAGCGFHGVLTSG
ncbi:MAG TPA: hypothetical protein VGG41_15005 [Solirubrobacteraceae bacterium]|jgi:hypothetical protein